MMLDLCRRLLGREVVLQHYDQGVELPKDRIFHRWEGPIPVEPSDSAAPVRVAPEDLVPEVPVLVLREVEALELADSYVAPGPAHPGVFDLDLGPVIQMVVAVRLCDET